MRSRRLDQFQTTPTLDELVPPFACEYAHLPQNAHKLAVADEGGVVHVVDTAARAPEARFEAAAAWTAHQHAIFDVRWLDGDRRMLTASGDQTVRLWDVETQRLLATCAGHSGSVKAAAPSPSDPTLVVSAGRDGRVCVWDIRVQKKVVDNSLQSPWATLEYGHVPDAKTAAGSAARPRKRRRGACAAFATDYPRFGVTCAAFAGAQRPSTVLTSGAADGTIKAWDLRASLARPTDVAQYPGPRQRVHGFTWLAVDSSGSSVYAACGDNHIYRYRIQHLAEPIATMSADAFRCGSFYIKIAVSPDDEWLAACTSPLAVGSGDASAGGVVVWSTRSNRPPAYFLRGAPAESSCVAWMQHSSAGEYELATGSDASLVRVWRTDLTSKTSLRQFGPGQEPTPEPTPEPAPAIDPAVFLPRSWFAQDDGQVFRLWSR